MKLDRVVEKRAAGNSDSCPGRVEVGAAPAGHLAAHLASTGRRTRRRFRSARRRAGLILLALIPTAPAAPFAEDAPDLETLLADWAKRGREVRSVRADFVRSHHTQLMRKPLVSRGRFYWTPEAMRWQTTEPDASEMLIKDRLVELYYPELKLLERYRLREQDTFWSSLPGVTMSIERIRADYAIAIEPDTATAEGGSADDPNRREDAESPTVGEGRAPKAGGGRSSTTGAGRSDTSGVDPTSPSGGNDGGARRVALRLTPLRPGIAEHIRSIRLWTSTDRFIPERVEYVERGGDVVSIAFENVELGVALDASVFTLDLPEGVEISEPFAAERSASPGD